jgi:hypothetical protein
MGNILGTSGLTYGGKETTDILLKPSFQDPALNSVFRIMTDIKSSEKMYLLNPLSYITREYGSCGLPAAASGVNITQKTLTTSPLEAFVEECPDVFSNTVFENWKKSGADVNDITGTEIEKIIGKITMDAAIRDAFRLATLGDSTGSDVRYTPVDGMWRLIFDNVESYCIDRTEYLTDGTLSADAALGYLKTLYNNCDNILKSVPENDKHFLVTGSIYDNLLASYESKTAGTAEIQFNWLVNGVASLKFRGIEVKPIRSWDTYISADLANAHPHRIVYTKKDNWVLGVEKESDMTTFRSWYSQDDDIYRSLLRYRMGVQFVHCDLTAVAY